MFQLTHLLGTKRFNFVSFVLGFSMMTSEVALITQHRKLDLLAWFRESFVVTSIRSQGWKKTWPKSQTSWWHMQRPPSVWQGEEAKRWLRSGPKKLGTFLLCKNRPFFSVTGHSRTI